MQVELKSHSHCGGQICNSIFAAGQEAGKYTIGVDTDQSGDSDTVITSALKDVKGATIEALNAYKKINSKVEKQLL